MLKLFTVYVYLQALFCGCGPDVRRSGFERLRKEYKVKIERIGRLDKRIAESSGIVKATDSTFWTHPDGGPDNVLHLFDLKGRLLKTITLPIPNKDWEDITRDEAGNLYIGDFGNNANTRKDLAVFKLDAATKQVTETIEFEYQDQHVFPPPYLQRHYDAEAFFFRSDSLYLFTKSRSFKGLTKLYRLPVHAGKYTLAPLQELQVKSPITAAAIAPDQQEFSLLGYGRLYLFQPETGAVSLNAPRYCLTVGRTGQAEALVYLTPTQLLVTNENGKLFLITLEKK